MQLTHNGQVSVIEQIRSAGYPRCREELPGICVESGKYFFRFARTAEDLDQILRLRFDVFNLEMGEGLDQSYLTSRDEDEFDLHCHHLMVVERGTSRLVGTYRMQTESMAASGRGFYSDAEFDLSLLPSEIRSQSVELGRACISAEHRNGRVLFLLWKGLANYLVHNSKRYFFGCCSLTSQDSREGWAVYRHLAARHQLHPQFTLPARQMFSLADEQDALDTRTVKLPKLMQLYLNYGALICSRPAIDRAFKTIDYLAFFDLNTLSDRTRELFLE